MSGSLFHSQEDINVSEDFCSSPRNKLHGAASIEDAEVQVEDSYKLTDQLPIPWDEVQSLNSQGHIQSSLDIVHQTPQGSAVPATPPRTVQPSKASKEIGKTMAGNTSITAPVSGAAKAGKDAPKAVNADKVLKSQAEKLNQTSGQLSSGRLQKLNYYGSEAGVSSSQAKDNAKQQSKRKPEATKATKDDTFDIPIEHEEAPAAKKRGRPKKIDAAATNSTKQKNLTSSKTAKVDSQAVKGKNTTRSKQKAAEADPDDEFIGSTKALVNNPAAQKITNTRSTRSKQPTARPDTVRPPQQAQLQAQRSSNVRNEDHNQPNASGGDYDHETFAQFMSEMVDLHEHEHEDEHEDEHGYEHDDEHEDEPKKQKEPSQYSLGMRLIAFNDDIDDSVLHRDENNITLEHPVSARTRKMPPPKVSQPRTPVAVMLGITNKTQQAKTTPLVETQMNPDAKYRKESLVPFNASGPRIQGMTKTGKSPEDPSVQQDFSIVDRGGTKQLVVAASKPFAPYKPAVGEDVQSLLENMNPLNAKRNESVRDEQSRSAIVFDDRASEVEGSGHQEPESPLSAHTEMTSPHVSHFGERHLSEPTKMLTLIETNAGQSIRSVENTVATGQEEQIRLVVQAMREPNQRKIDQSQEDCPDLNAATTNDLADLSSSDDECTETLERVAPNGSPLAAHTAPHASINASTTAQTRLNEAVAIQETKKVHFMAVASPHKHAAAQQMPVDRADVCLAENEEVQHIEIAREHRRASYKVPDQGVTHVNMVKEKAVVQTKEAVIAAQALAVALVPTQRGHDKPETAEAQATKPVQHSQPLGADKARSIAAHKVHKTMQTPPRESPEQAVETVGSHPAKEVVTRNTMKMLLSESPDDQVSVPLNKSIGEEFEGDTEEEGEGDADVQMLDDDDPDRTLVNEDEVDDQDNETESSMYEGSDSEPESEVMRSPSQDTVVERDQWRAALAGYQVNLFDSLVEISHHLVRNLVDQETAVGDILSDYQRDGFHLIEHLKLEQRRSVAEWQNQVTQADSQLRKDLQGPSAKLDKYITIMQQLRKETPKRDMAAINTQFKALLPSE